MKQTCLGFLELRLAKLLCYVYCLIFRYNSLFRSQTEISARVSENPL